MIFGNTKSKANELADSINDILSLFCQIKNNNENPTEDMFSGKVIDKIIFQINKNKSFFCKKTITIGKTKLLVAAFVIREFYLKHGKSHTNVLFNCFNNNNYLNIESFKKWVFENLNKLKQESIHIKRNSVHDIDINRFIQGIDPCNLKNISLFFVNNKTDGYRGYSIRFAIDGELSRVRLLVLQEKITVVVDPIQSNKKATTFEDYKNDIYRHLGHLSLNTYKDANTNARKGVNPVFFIEKSKENSEVKKLVYKPLNNEQESTIETITGEIYRYLIGNSQPKTKLAPCFGIVSQMIPYFSIRDYFYAKSGDNDCYLKYFQQDYKGFVNILMSSIFLEENDLHDGNFGFGPDNKLIKIDHGQSLNTLRIEKSKTLKFAEIKYYDEVYYKKSDAGRSYKEKGYRKTSFGTVRKYSITGDYLDNFMLTFLQGNYNLSFIKKQEFRPSIFPTYDLRITHFFPLSTAHHEKLMQYQNEAIYKIINTPNEWYQFIALNAAQSENRILIEKVIKKILDRKQELKKAAFSSKRYVKFLNQVQSVDSIYKQDILNSFERFSKSKRYFNSLTHSKRA